MKASEAMSATKYGAFAVVAVLALSGVSLGWKYLTAEVSGRVNAEVQIESAPSRMANYETYFDQCAAIQGYEGSIAIHEPTLASVTGDEAERLRVVLSGIKAQRLRAIAQYNQDVRKEYTMGRFFDPRLPTHIDPRAEATQCAN